MSAQALRPPGPRGQCLECGADARGRLGRTFLYDRSAELDYTDAPAAVARIIERPFKHVRLCNYHAGEADRDFELNGWP